MILLWLRWEEELKEFVNGFDVLIDINSID